MSYQDILVPTDFGAGSRAALEHALESLDPAGGRISVLHVIDQRFIEQTLTVVPDIDAARLHDRLHEQAQQQYAELVKGLDMGAPSPDELEAMRRLTEEAMEDGAFGVSYALIYPPDAYTEIDELVSICEVVARRRGTYITHIRSEADAIFEALEEAFAVGKRAGVPVEIYHLKASGRKNWPKMPRVIEMIEEARARVSQTA